MKVIPLIWFIFTVLFACCGAYHYYQSQQSYPRFEWEPLTTGEGEFVSHTPIENKHNLKKFISEWNDHIDNQNDRSHIINLIASFAYFASSFMAFVAMKLPGPYNINETKYYLYDKFSKAYSRYF